MYWRLPDAPEPPTSHVRIEASTGLGGLPALASDVFDCNEFDRLQEGLWCFGLGCAMLFLADLRCAGLSFTGLASLCVAARVCSQSGACGLQTAPKCVGQRDPSLCVGFLFVLCPLWGYKTDRRSTTGTPWQQKGSSGQRSVTWRAARSLLSGRNGFGARSGCPCITQLKEGFRPQGACCSLVLRTCWNESVRLSWSMWARADAGNWPAETDCLLKKLLRNNRRTCRAWLVGRCYPRPWRGNDPFFICFLRPPWSKTKPRALVGPMYGWSKRREAGFDGGLQVLTRTDCLG